MTVQVILKEKGTNFPIRSVSVHIENEDYEYNETTNMLGRAYFQNIKDGEYLIKIQNLNYRPHYEKTYLSQNSILDIKLDKSIV